MRHAISVGILGLAVIIVLRTIRFGVAKRAAGTREFASTQRL